MCPTLHIMCIIIYIQYVHVARQHYVCTSPVTQCTCVHMELYVFVVLLMSSLLHYTIHGKILQGQIWRKAYNLPIFSLPNIYKYIEMTENRSADLPSPNAIISNESPKFSPS